MTLQELQKQLYAEGFTRVYAWQDAANAYYPDHSHPALTAHIILEGQMALTMKGETRTYCPGERCDVGAGVVHSARMGPAGCRYLIGEK